jgi:hypothetical protein
MSDQASVKDGSAAPGSGGGAKAGPDRGFAEFINDLVTLAELQADLAILNTRESAREAAAPLGLIVFSLMLLAIGVTLCLIGAALLLASSLGIDRGWALIATAGFAIVMASLAVAVGLARLRTCFQPFRSSREELGRNLTWLRDVLIRRQEDVARGVK